jgi:hypothetical protein
VRARDEAEQSSGAGPGRARPAAKPSARRLASRIGNRGFGRLLRDTGTGAGTAVADLAQDAAKLAAETPSTDVEYATWLLAAAEAGFAVLWKDTRATLEAFSAGNPSHGVQPSATDVTVRALVTMFDLVRGAMRRSAGAPGAVKRAVTLGSLLRDKTGPHAGAAIDLPRAMGPGSVDEVVAMLADLSPGRYGIGLPFSGDYFDPDDALDAKQKAAQAAVADGGTPAAVSRALQLDAAHTYKVGWDADKNSWGKPVTDQAGAAYTLLKSTALKDLLQRMRHAGSTLVIFPDRPGHVHIDQR